MYTTTLGADVEFFFINSNGVVVPSEQILPPKKDALELNHSLFTQGVKPTKHQDYLPCAALHLDGIQGELTIAPSECREWLMDYFRMGLVQVRSMARERELNLSLSSTVETPKELLESAKLRASVAFGCDPDFSAWGMGSRGVDAYTHYKRYAGCHVHVATPEFASNMDQIIQMIQMMDIFLGCVMVLTEQGNDTVVERRKVFGAAGSYRPTEYGFEYRTPSASMMVHPVLYQYAFAVGWLVYNLSLEDQFDSVAGALDKQPERIIDAINNNDVDNAKWVLERVLSFIKPYSQIWNAFQAVLIALSNGHLHPLNFEDNWCLEDPSDSLHGVLGSGKSLHKDSFYVQNYAPVSLEDL